MTRHLENTHKAKISTLKTTKCGKIMKLKSPSKYPPALQQKTHQQSNHVITATSVNSQSVVEQIHKTSIIMNTLALNNYLKA